MADPRGFMKYTERELPARRPVDVRIGDWKEVYGAADPSALTRQASRCMDCGVPFCHQGCPLGNLIPEWNDLVRRGELTLLPLFLMYHDPNLLNFPHLTRVNIVLLREYDIVSMLLLKSKVVILL